MGADMMRGGLLYNAKRRHWHRTKLGFRPDGESYVADFVRNHCNGEPLFTDAFCYGDQKHFLLAHFFNKPSFLGILAMKANHMSDFHTNTHIPIVIGAQMRYEITGDELYKYISSSGNWNSTRISLSKGVNEVLPLDQCLKFRIPSWTSTNGLKASLNRSPVSLLNPGSFLSIGKSQSEGDEIALEFPLGIRRESTSNWIIPILDEYNSHLVSRIQVITLEGSPQAGNDSYVHACFRLILEDPSRIKAKFLGPDIFIGKTVMFEPFDHLGMVVARKGTGEGLMINSDFEKGTPEFLIVKGLSGEDGMISLKTNDGCFIYTSGVDVKLNCETGSLDDEFKLAASFIWNKRLREYHPNSFVAKWVRRSYVLEPLLGLRDETYNVYFIITN
ncbi:hypothetical protein Cgig2_027403 [Carnegiea gigantea]|uniref:Non-reducing end beta-L-arabinofuranosidase-like GH127 catalytic domain-containing protein n=1 Tax=Carnegiea gigantea TaxID=171969 RepID=A0A9Q1JGR6_9CARY|nr:hypothetical protein Cgig2_027403 [Carnegiea gigantea]